MAQVLSNLKQMHEASPAHVMQACRACRDISAPLSTSGAGRTLVPVPNKYHPLRRDEREGLPARTGPAYLPGCAASDGRALRSCWLRSARNQQPGAWRTQLHEDSKAGAMPRTAKQEPWLGQLQAWWDWRTHTCTHTHTQTHARMRTKTRASHPSPYTNRSHARTEVGHLTFLLAPPVQLIDPSPTLFPRSLRASVQARAECWHSSLSPKAARVKRPMRKSVAKATEHLPAVPAHWTASDA